MRVYLLLFSFILSGIFAEAQQSYDASLIPKELLPYASSVVRTKEETVTVKDLEDVVYHIKEAITVLNKNGDGRIFIEHDKSRSIKNAKGILYDEFGKQIGKFSESDFEDESAAHDFSLFEDARVKYYIPKVNQYPYTIAYEYEVHINQTLELPEWQPNPETGVAVEKSSFTFVCPPSFSIRYKEINLAGKAEISTSAKNEKIYSWQLKNIKALKNEPYSPDQETFMSSVKIAPEHFKYYGYDGAFNNWQQLGKWINDKLLVNRQNVPVETVWHIKELTKDIADPKLKAKRVYEYVQSKTHYISVQVGIGGYQPFLADDVDKQNYGDCKALVNYTQALLKAIDIDSYYCVVEAGRKHNISMMPDFASMQQGNHIILCIPFKNDTTWADCTSQTIPFGYLGDFTDDRIVLACTPEGGKLMRTPKYTAKNSSETRKADFTINQNGVLSGLMTTVYKGADYDNDDELITEPQAEQVKRFKLKYALNNLEIENAELKQDKSFDPSTTEKLKLQAFDYASQSDGKYFFLANSVNRINEPPRQVRNRVNDVNITRGYTEEDEITYTIPAGYHLEKEPLNVADDKPFGNFSARIILKGNQLIYHRKLQMNGGTYSKDTYPDLVDFYETVVDADGYNVVLIKNN